MFSIADVVHNIVFNRLSKNWHVHYICINKSISTECALTDIGTAGNVSKGSDDIHKRNYFLPTVIRLRHN